MTNNVVFINQHITLGKFEQMVDRLTANAILYGAPEAMFANIEALHKIAKQMRADLQEQQRERTVEQLEQSLAQRKCAEIGENHG